MLYQEINLPIWAELLIQLGDRVDALEDDMGVLL